MPKTILSNKGKSGFITIPHLKLYYKVSVIKTVWYWAGDRLEDEWNRLEDVYTTTNTLSHFIFDKDAKCIHWKKEPL